MCAELIARLRIAFTTYGNVDAIVVFHFFVEVGSFASIINARFFSIFLDGYLSVGESF